MKKLISTAQLAARNKFRNRFPKVWFITYGDKAQAVIINAMHKEVLLYGPICDTPEEALKLLTASIRPNPRKTSHET